jgi:hypothetical protein
VQRYTELQYSLPVHHQPVAPTPALGWSSCVPEQTHHDNGVMAACGSSVAQGLSVRTSTMVPLQMPSMRSVPRSRATSLAVSRRPCHDGAVPAAPATPSGSRLALPSRVSVSPEAPPALDTPSSPQVAAAA